MKTLQALKRLEGLAEKLDSMVGQEEYCPKILELLLAMQGHLKYIQALVLENHLSTCAERKLSSKDKKIFITELLKVIGLSTRS